MGEVEGRETVNKAAGPRALAVALMKIANDLRWLASGPGCGSAGVKTIKGQ